MSGWVLSSMHERTPDPEEPTETDDITGFFIVDKSTNTKKCTICGTTNIPLNVFGTRIRIEDVNTHACTADNTPVAPICDFETLVGNDSTPHSNIHRLIPINRNSYDDAYKTDSVLPIYFMALKIKTTPPPNMYNGWFMWDNPAYSDARVSFNLQELKFENDHIMQQQYIGDASMITSDLFPQNNSSNMFRDLHFNSLTMSMVCPYFRQMTEKYRTKRYNTGKAMSSTKMYTFPIDYDPVSLRLYVYVVLSGGKFPGSLPYRFVSELYTTNARLFKNSWVTSLCHDIMIGTIDRTTVFHRLQEAVSHNDARIYDACYAFVAANYVSEHYTVQLTAKTDVGFFIRLLEDETLDADMRFISAKMFLHARQNYHKPYEHAGDVATMNEVERQQQMLHNTKYHECLRVTAAVPWATVSIKTLREVNNQIASNTFRSHCTLVYFWKELAHTLAVNQ